MLIKRNKTRKAETITKPHKRIRPRLIRMERISDGTANDIFFAVIYNLSLKGLDLYEIDQNHVTLPVSFQGKVVADVLINRRCSSTYDMQNCHVDVLYYDYAELLLEEDFIYDAIEDGARNVASALNWIEENMPQEINVDGYDLKTDREVSRMVLDIQNVMLQIETGLFQIDDMMKDYKYRLGSREGRRIRKTARK